LRDQRGPLEAIDRGSRFAQHLAKGTIQLTVDGLTYADPRHRG
jgi:hypothetical protein